MPTTILTNKEQSSAAGNPLQYDMDTQCVHAGTVPCPLTGAILPPIYQNTTFVQESIDSYLAKGYSYSRSDNPTVRVLENKIAALEKGADACCFSSGMAATCTLFSIFLKPGDRCIVTNCSYGGTNRAARLHFANYGIDFQFVDMTDVKNVADKITSNTTVIFSESPTNPILSLVNVEEISKLSKCHGIIHICDSTFATPLIMMPMEFGADFTLISTTKFYDGHNLTVGGAVVSATQQHDERVRWMRNVMGNIMAPHTAFYQLQCAKTLAIRIRQQSATAQRIAKYLCGHPKVERVGYPGLECFPQRQLAQKQHSNGLHGGMLWFEVKGGNVAGRKLMDTIGAPWSLCENLGSVESIITCPAVFTHAAMKREDRLAVGITDGFIRVSCGIESCDDLVDALEKSFANL